MSAVIEAPAEDAERAAILAERAATLAAQDELVALHEAKFDGLVATLREVLRGEHPGMAFDPLLRQIDEEARKLHHLVQHRMNLPRRWEREDASGTVPLRAPLRKTLASSPAHWPMIATPLLRAFGVENRCAPGDARLNAHDLLIELKIGEDMTPDEQRAEAFRRLCGHVGSYVDSDLLLDGERDEDGRIVALLLSGRRLPPIAMPQDDAGQRVHARLLMLEQRLTVEFRGLGPVPTRDEQQIARQCAWHRLLDEARLDPAQKGKHRGQIEAELIKVHPAWAREIGMQVPD